MDWEQSDGLRWGEQPGCEEGGLGTIKRAFVQLTVWLHSDDQLQLDRVVRSVSKILLRPEVPLGRLD